MPPTPTWDSRRPNISNNTLLALDRRALDRRDPAVSCRHWVAVGLAGGRISLSHSHRGTPIAMFVHQLLQAAAVDLVEESMVRQQEAFRLVLVEVHGPARLSMDLVEGSIVETSIVEAFQNAVQHAADSADAPAVVEIPRHLPGRHAEWFHRRLIRIQVVHAVHVAVQVLAVVRHVADLADVPVMLQVRQQEAFRLVLVEVPGPARLSTNLDLLEGLIVEAFHDAVQHAADSADAPAVVENSCRLSERHLESFHPILIRIQAVHAVHVAVQVLAAVRHVADLADVHVMLQDRRQEASRRILVDFDGPALLLCR